MSESPSAMWCVLGGMMFFALIDIVLHAVLGWPGGIDESTTVLGAIFGLAFWLDQGGRDE